MDLTHGRTNERQVVARYGAYAEAQRAVDYLSDQGFPVERLSIVGRELSLVERVTGRKGYLQAATQGAASGAFLGFFLGFVFGVFSIVDPLVSGIALALYGVVIGAVAGAVLGLISHAMTKGARDFSSVGGLEAEHFEVLAEPGQAERARQLLSQL